MHTAGFTRAAAIAAGLAAISGSVAPVGADDAAAPAAGERLAFFACPLVRDTHLPCWLAAHEGELYFLGPQGDLGAPFYPPQLNHQALVEGVVSDQPRICGGVVLDPVQVSVLPEIDRSCNTILPSEGYDDPPNHRGPGPSGDPADFGLPPELQSQPEEEEELPEPTTLTGEQVFPVYFSYDVGQRLFARNARPVELALRYAQETGGAVAVRGFRGSVLLSDGGLAPEGESVAQTRAEMVRGMLVGAGLDPDVIEVSWDSTVQGGDGVDDHLERRVEIVVTPS